jgi:prepilin-type N-terminal cleavage/methylation domain-containing protein
MNKKGFTLIELVMVIVILGILAAMVLPRFIDLQSEAKKSATRGGLGALRAAIAVTYSSRAAVNVTPYVPTTVDVSMFQDSQIPMDQIVTPANSAVVISDDVPPATANAGGWWYNSVNGRIWINNSQYTAW